MVKGSISKEFLIFDFPSRDVVLFRFASTLLNFTLLRRIKFLLNLIFDKLEIMKFALNVI